MKNHTKKITATENGFSNPFSETANSQTDRNVRSPLFSILAAAALVAGSLTTAEAQTYPVVGDNTTALNVAGGWLSGLPFPYIPISDEEDPKYPGYYDFASPNTIIAVWQNAGGQSKSIGESMYLRGLQFNAVTGTQTQTITGTGFTISLGAAGLTIANNGPNVTLSTTLNITANQTWTIPTGSTLTFANSNGTITSTTGTTLTLTGSGILAINNNNPKLGTAGLIFGDGFHLRYNNNLTNSLANTAVTFEGDFYYNGINATPSIFAIGSAISSAITFSKAVGQQTVYISATSGGLRIGGQNTSGTVTGKDVALRIENYDPENVIPMRAVIIFGGTGGSTGPAVTLEKLTIGGGVMLGFSANGSTTAHNGYELRNTIALTIDPNGILAISQVTGIDASRNPTGGARGASQTIGSLSGAGNIYGPWDSAASNGNSTLFIDGSIVSVGIQNYTTTFSGMIADGKVYSSTANQGIVSLDKRGDSIQILTGTNKYTGTTTLRSGTLQIDGDNSACTGNVTVQNLATLAGSGKIGGATSVASGGILIVQSGSTPQSDGLTFKNGLTITGGAGAAGAVLMVNVSSFLTITSGTLTLASGTNSFNLNLLGDNTLWEVGDGYITNIFDVSALGVTVVGNWDVSHVTLASTGGLDLSGVTFREQGGYFSLVGIRAVIPEPSTYLLLGASLLAVVIFRRRK